MVVEGIINSLSIPTKVYYGRKISESAIDKIADETMLLQNNILIVTTGRSLKKFGYVDILLKQIKRLANEFVIEVYDDISANPRVEEVARGICVAKNISAGLIIGFGGGSALDAAKAIAAGAVSELSINEIFHKGIEPKDSLPVIAIPTTAGTGSELSKAAILTDEAAHKKSGIRGVNLFPQIAIVDSYFTESVPYKITMETGFDVLAHAIESYVSKASTPFSEMLSEYVIRRAGGAIKVLSKDLKNIDARAQMSYCSMIMGINLGNTGTALPHRMQYPIGAHSNSSHGAGLAALYSSWMKYEQNYSPEKVDNILSMLKVDSIGELLSQCRLDIKLNDLGLNSTEIETLVKDVSGKLENDPAFDENDILRKIYSESM